jgi:hypothetical protein
MDSGLSGVETTSAPVLGPTRAFVVFVVFFVVQFGAGLVIGILAGSCTPSTTRVRSSPSPTSSAWWW